MAILDIEISAEALERQGWELSARNESAVALFLERRCQGLLLAFLQTDYLITGDLAQSIQHFYRVFRQIKDAWPADSNRKIWRRNVPASQRRTLHGLPERGNFGKSYADFVADWDTDAAGDSAILG